MLRRSPWFAAAWRTVLLALVLATACLPALSDAETPTWHVLLYFDADDEMLEHSIWQDFNEAELVGSSDRVTIIAQFDRYAGGFDGDGDWSSTRRYRVEKDDDRAQVHGYGAVWEQVEDGAAEGASLVEAEGK